MRVFKVGIAEYKIVSTPDVLQCLGLGSCVSVFLYDPVSKMGGVAHSLLPDSGEVGNNHQANTKPAKFVDTAVPAVLSGMVKRKAEKKRITAKIAGGACMFSPNGSPKDGIFDVGKRNVAAVKKALKKEGIKILAQDTKGSNGRSVDFYTESGKMVVRSKTGSLKL
jgi:chemotaxis protein CheD